MSLIPVPYSDSPNGPKALLVHIRLPGQRWRHLACFGRLGHYYEDGACEHTDALTAEMTPYGKKVTKLQPFGDGEKRPKRPRKRPPVSSDAGATVKSQPPKED